MSFSRSHLALSTRLVALCACLGLFGLTATQIQASTDKASWITQTSDYVLNNMPRVDSFMWFNNYKPGMGEPDWRVVPTPPPSPAPAPEMSVINAYNNAWSNGVTTLQRGVFIDGVPAATGTLDTFESYVGHHDRVGWFESFASDFPLANAQTVTARGSRPYIVWQPYDESAGISSRGNQSLLPSIISGAYNDRIAAWAQAAKDFGGPIDIALGHEMNGNWFSWGYLPDDFYNNAQTLTDPNLVGHNGNTPGMYVSMFRQVVDIFNQVGANNVSFVWDVNADWVDDFTVAFPGEAYVDRLGMNGFNWGRQAAADPNNPGWDDWREGVHIFDNWYGFSTYATLAGLPGNLPIIIGETGTNVPEPSTVAFLIAGSMLVLRRRR